jgi:hypothetical protein
LPPSLQRKIAETPAAGTGLNAYLRKVQAELRHYPFICPNPMRERGEYEYGKEWKPEKPSPRRDSNVLYRRWLVIEFDVSPVARDGKTPTFWKPLSGAMGSKRHFTYQCADTANRQASQF